MPLCPAQAPRFLDFLTNKTMMTNNEYKQAAKSALRGNWTRAVVASIVYLLTILLIAGIFGLHSKEDVSAITAAFLGLELASVVAQVFIQNPLDMGYANAFRELYQRGDGQIVSNMFRIPLKNYLHVVWTIVWMNIKISLWTLLLVVPGIIKSFAYAMTPFIIAEHPELSADEATHQSSMMMQGHKFDYFYLLLTFIGWFFLALLTAGIGFFWLMPYIKTTCAAFYNDLKTNEGVIEATVIS